MIDYEQLLELLRSRRSIRRFADQAVSREDLARLLEAARWAPSNHNRQGWRLLVFADRARIRSLAEHVKSGLRERFQGVSRLPAEAMEDLVRHATWFGEAPCLAVVLSKGPSAAGAGLLEGLAHPDLVSGEPLSAAMATQNFLLLAHASGLGACILTAPLLAPGALDAIPDVPSGFRVLCLVALGYPAEDPAPPRRKALEHLLDFRG